MTKIWYGVTRILHPITIAVILVGVTGFLLGLIVAVERQGAAALAPQIDGALAEQIAHLETTLESREAELAKLQTDLIDRPVEPLTSAEFSDAASRIVDLELALSDRSADRDALEGELTELSVQLAEAIQARDELQAQFDKTLADSEKELTELAGQLAAVIQSQDGFRAESEKTQGENESVRAGLEQTISDLRLQLRSGSEAATPVTPVAIPVDRQVVEGPRDEPAAIVETRDADEPPVSEPPVSEPTPAVAAASSAAPEAGGEEAVTPLSETTVSANTTVPPSTSPPSTSGPISRGIAAYRVANYRRAYELWLPAALNGSARAQFFVGALYFEGRGVPNDRVLSYMWLRAATRNDDPGAIKLLDRVREGMSGAELAEAETRIASGATIPEG